MSEHSIFYKNLSRKFKVPMLCYEYISEQIQSLEGDNEEGYLEIYCKALEDICKVNPTDDNLNYLIEVLTTSSQVSESKPASSKGSKGFCSSFYNYFFDLQSDKMLLQICGYDIDKAYKLYCEEDREDVLALIDSYVSRTQQDQTVLLESCVYGFGGSMEDSNSSVVEFDLTNNFEDAEKALKAFF